MIIESIVVGEYEVNCYVIAQGPGRQAILIDPGADKAKIEQVLSKHNLKVAMVLNTHGHFDHIGCDGEFGAPVYIHRLDLPLLSSAQMNLSNLVGQPFVVKAEANILEDGQIVGTDGMELEVIYTPGHARGAVCFLMKKPEHDILFSGDTLFHRSIGRTDIAGSSTKQLMECILKKLFILSDNTICYPGHGRPTTIGDEKKNNPFFNL